MTEHARMHIHKYLVNINCDDNNDDDVSLYIYISEFLWPVHVGTELQGHRICIKSMLLKYSAEISYPKYFLFLPFPMFGSSLIYFNKVYNILHKG